MRVNQQQNHLDYHSRVNLGSYYTDTQFVNSAWHMLDDYIDDETTIVDTSCGYGNFLKNHPKMIGIDVDEIAISKAKKQHNKLNSLLLIL